MDAGRSRSSAPCGGRPGNAPEYQHEMKPQGTTRARYAPLGAVGRGYRFSFFSPKEIFSLICNELRRLRSGQRLRARRFRATHTLKQTDVAFGLGGLVFFRGCAGLGTFGGHGAGKNLDFLFRIGQAISARFDQAHAFLVMGEELFKRQVGGFHVGNDLFEAGEEFLEFCGGLAGFGSGGKKASGHGEGMLALGRPNGNPERCLRLILLASSCVQCHAEKYPL